MCSFSLRTADIQTAENAAHVSAVDQIDHVAPFRDRHFRRLFFQCPGEVLCNLRSEGQRLSQLGHEEVCLPGVINHWGSATPQRRAIARWGDERKSRASG